MHHTDPLMFFTERTSSDREGPGIGSPAARRFSLAPGERAHEGAYCISEQALVQ